MSTLFHRVTCRGKSRQSARRMLSLLAHDYFTPTPKAVPEVPSMPASVNGPSNRPPQPEVLLAPDTTVRQQLEVDGFVAYSAPSVRSNLIDVECWTNEQCGHCWERALIVIPFERPHGEGYTVLLECLECGHQETV